MTARSYCNLSLNQVYRNILIDMSVVDSASVVSSSSSSPLWQLIEKPGEPKHLPFGSSFQVHINSIIKRGFFGDVIMILTLDLTNNEYINAFTPL